VQVRVYFIDSQNGMFNTGSVYTTGNVDGPKFDFFCKAALEFMLKSGDQCSPYYH
jgi:starch synthase